MRSRLRLAAFALALWALTLALALMPNAAVQAAERPDFSGIWQVRHPIEQLKDLDGQPPPLRPAAQALYARRLQQLHHGKRDFDPSVSECKPPGEPRILYESDPLQIVQTPRQLIFIYDWNRLFRLVDIDQPRQVLSPTYFGTSTAHWQGDTLVVNVRGLHEGTLLDAAGLPHSAALQLEERYRLTDQGRQLQVTLSFDDPQIFSRPWQTRVVLRKLPTDRLGEDICELREGLVKGIYSNAPDF